MTVAGNLGKGVPMGSASDAKAVSASASALPDGPCRALLIGADGTISFTTVGGTTISAWPVVAGQTLPIQCTHVTALVTATCLALY